jgi:hypothetical protein
MMITNCEVLKIDKRSCCSGSCYSNYRIIKTAATAVSKKLSAVLQIESSMLCVCALCCVERAFLSCCLLAEV